ncbi:MAG TPA: class I SAM-dependent methyltransferase [Bryobacteraceae bacterium]|nr:class I SAM-dependent methyltransferase [Bryobacteraceae bacterium]
MNCDPIARWYRWLEYAGFGGALQRRRLAFLSDVADARRVLLLGEGDGRFLVELVRQNRSASIDYVDLSWRMLELARRAGDRVNYRQGDALVIPLPESEYDLIITHFFLDCFDAAELTRLIERVARAARPDARWLVSEFREPSAWARAVVRMLYWFFRITTGLKTSRLADHRLLLEQRGFRLIREERARAGLLASELWSRAKPELRLEQPC